MEQQKKNSGLGIAALVFGILSLVAPCFLFSLLSIIFGGLRKKEPFGKAGLSLGIIGVVISVIVISCLAVFA